MLLTRTIAPVALPVSLLDAKEHLRVSSDAEDRTIERMLASAVASIGEMSGRSMAPETWRLGLDSISGDLVLPKSPVTAVSGITYYDPSNTSQTFDLANLDVILSDDVSILSLKPGSSWPSMVRRADAISITFVAGYTTLPEPLETAVLLFLGNLYENRAAAGEAKTPLPYGVEHAVGLYKLGWAAG